MTHLKYLFVYLSIQSTLLFGFCEKQEDISLFTFQVAERHALQQVRQIRIANNVALRARTVEERKIDLKAYEKLFRKGFLSESELEIVELAVDEAKLNLESAKLDLEQIEGSIEVTMQELELSCGQEPASSAEISKFADIYLKRWEQRLFVLAPRIEITKRQIEKLRERLEWLEFMHSRGYRSKTEVRDAAVRVFQFEKTLENQTGEVKIGKEFVEKLKELV